MLQWVLQWQLKVLQHQLWVLMQSEAQWESVVWKKAPWEKLWVEL